VVAMSQVPQKLDAKTEIIRKFDRYNETYLKN
jgi:hypothetical protein